MHLCFHVHHHQLLMSLCIFIFCRHVFWIIFCQVRKKAQAVVPVMMSKVGYDAMLKQSGKLKVRGGEGRERKGYTHILLSSWKFLFLL